MSKMEFFPVTFPEYEVLKYFKNRLESFLNVRITMPELHNQLLPNGTVCVQISGQQRNIAYVKKYLKRKMKRYKAPNGLKGVKLSTNSSGANVPVITLSEEEDSLEAQKNSVISAEKSNVVTSSLGCVQDSDLSSTSQNTRYEESASEEDSVIVLSDEDEDYPHKVTSAPSKWAGQNAALGSSMESEICAADSSNMNQNSPSGSCQQSASSSSQNADDSIIVLSEVTVSSTSSKPLQKSRALSNKQNSSSSSMNVSVEIVLDEVTQPSLPEFIPLRVHNAPPPPKKIKRNEEMVSVPSKRQRVLMPIVSVPPNMQRVLRPIVIDGSNVAREHGKHTNTFSCKGIKLCVDYFLQRGHSDVTVFVPNFRKYVVTMGPVITTNPELLEELERSNHLVYTPSRKINGKRITCYDDRFVVDLASKTNGVILSNDLFRDIIDESESFRKTIEERLLMFCFVHDRLMIPQDPLGITGPTLDEFLSMPMSPVCDASLTVNIHCKKLC